MRHSNESALFHLLSNENATVSLHTRVLFFRYSYSYTGSKDSDLKSVYTKPAYKITIYSPLYTESQETIDTFEDSEESDTDVETSDEEPSSGYQTSDVKSPQNPINQKHIHSVWKIPNTSLVYHCSDEYRNNLLICQFDLKIEQENDGKRFVRKHINLTINKLSHYLNGEFSEVSRKVCLILNMGQKQGETTSDTLTVSPVAIHLRLGFLQEIGKMLNVIKDVRSLQTDPDLAVILPSNMWAQIKMVGHHPHPHQHHHPMLALWRRLDCGGLLDSEDLKCDLPSISFFLYSNEDQQPIMATRMKSSGLVKTGPGSPGCQGTLAIEAVVRDMKINRWQHLFHSDSLNKNVVNVDVSFGFLDLDSVMENLDEVPLINDCDVESINHVEDDSITPAEKIRFYYRSSVMRPETTHIETEDEQSEESRTDDSTNSNIQSRSLVSDVKVNNLQRTLILEVKDHLVINVSRSSLSYMRGESWKNLEKDWIRNCLGHGAEMKYTQLQSGKEDIIMAVPDKETAGDSSEEESEDSSVVPWRRCRNDKNLAFTGFEEAGTDDVNELTRVITAHNLYIDVIDFQPLKVLLPKTTGKATLLLTSEIDNDKYPFNVSSVFKGERQEISLESTTLVTNMTSMELSLYVESENLHWQLLSCAKASDNPFEIGVKLTELHSHTSYYIPLVLSKQAKFYIKPKDQKHSVSEKFFTNSQQFEDNFIFCSSLRDSKQIGFRIQTEEKSPGLVHKILPLTTIKNCLPATVDLDLIVGIHSYTLQSEECVDICELLDCEKIKLKVNNMETSLSLRPGWQMEERKSEYLLRIRDKGKERY